MFLSRDKKNDVYRCKPQFYKIKVGFKGAKIILACYRDVCLTLLVCGRAHPGSAIVLLLR